MKSVDPRQYLIVGHERQQENKDGLHSVTLPLVVQIRLLIMLLKKIASCALGSIMTFSEVEYYALTAALRWYLHIPTVCKLQMGKTVNVTDFSDALALLGPKCN